MLILKEAKIKKMFLMRDLEVYYWPLFLQVLLTCSAYKLFLEKPQLCSKSREENGAKMLN